MEFTIRMPERQLKFADERCSARTAINRKQAIRLGLEAVAYGNQSD